MQAGTQTRVTEEFVRRVIGVLPQPVALFDAMREDFRCLAANPPFVRRLRLGGTGLAGKPLREVFDRIQAERALEVFEEVCSGRAVGSLVLPAQVRPEERHALSSFDVLPVRGEDSRVSHILMVSAERAEAARSREGEAREAIRLRQRADHLEELEHAKSEFLNLASHELRGPAATLRGYLSMLEDGTLGPLSDALRQVLPVLQAKASQINVLASEMIEAARLEDRGLRLHREPIEMRQLLARLVANVQATAPHHRLVIHDRSPGPVIVSGDRLRLEIVVNNLLDNAVKYSPGGGDVYCDLVTVRGMMLLAVRDTGIGIAAEDMPRLFVRFSRLAAEHMPEVPGTGLGLYLARELARLHGGDIVAVSGLGEGSEFTLTLPLDAPTDS
jgi:signal transduction histidine kinase